MALSQINELGEAKLKAKIIDAKKKLHTHNSLKRKAKKEKMKFLKKQNEDAKLHLKESKKKEKEDTKIIEEEKQDLNIGMMKHKNHSLEKKKQTFEIMEEEGVKIEELLQDLDINKSNIPESKLN